MKPITLLLTASLFANVALVAFVATRSGDSAAPASAPTASKSPGAPAAGSDALRAALASGDTAALTAAGVPSDVARDLTLGRAFARYQQKMSAARTVPGDARWWRNRTGVRNREDGSVARRELSDAMIAAFGDDLGLAGGDMAQLAFLSPEKRNALRRITQDYDEMMAKFSAGGLQLASDKEKLRLLRAERDRDIAALLTPAELADYELRTSPSSATLRARYGDAIENEDDFKKLYALQKAFDDKFPLDAFNGRVSPDALRARSEAQAQLQNDIRAAVGDDKYAALRRATDGELRSLDSLVSRANLPADTTERFAASRETYAAESQRIMADTSITPAERRSKIQDLGLRAKSDLTSTLGTEVAEAFLPRASWVGMLQSGIGFSTTPTANSPGAVNLGGGTQSVYPVLPAGTGSPGGQRQSVTFVSGSTDAAAGPTPGGALLFGGGTPSGDPVNRTTQVISVSSSETTTTTNPPPAGTTTTITTKPNP